MPGLRLSWLPQELAICQLASDAPIPEWAKSSAFSSITRTPAELSIVCERAAVPANALPETSRDTLSCDQPWKALRIEGPLDLNLIGIALQVLEPLAAAGISVFVISTFDTDYILVRGENVAKTTEALTASGHAFGE